ncbi:MAG: cell surface protein SprA, partial [Bacteroidota bacterium]
FEGLYNRVPYLAKINRGNSRTRTRTGPTRRPATQDENNDDEEGDKKKKRDGPSVIERILIRPLMSLRKARFNYSERWETVIPGFLPVNQLFGQNQDFGAPGYDFVFGYQPRIRKLEESEYYTDADWLHNAAQNGWMSGSVFVNQEVIQRFTQDYEGRVTLEPFNEFRVELDLSRSFTEDHSEFFKDTLGNTGEWVHAIPKQIGQLNMTYSALPTLFQDDRDEIVGLFERFEANRLEISQRIGNGALHGDSLLAAQGFNEGYGRVQQDVLIPAFLAAYRDEDVNSVKLNVFDLLPSVNWNLTYNGLSRVPLFAEIFRNFSLRHGYKSNLTVSRFNTGLDYLRTVNTNGALNELNQNFYPRLEIPEIIIQEGFQPMIAVDATLENGMSFNIDYSKTRTLAMSFINNNLSESQSTSIVIGFGYLIRDLDIPFLTGSKKKKSNNRTAPAPTPGGGGGRGRGQAQNQDLDISFDFSLKDDVTFNHVLDQDIVEPTRGNYSLSISPAIESQLNQRLSLRLFV